MQCSAELSRGLVKPYGMAALRASPSPRLILMQQCDACTNSWQSVAISSNHAMNAMHAKSPNTIMSRTGRAHQIKRTSKCRGYIKYNTQTLTALPSIQTKLVL